MKNHRPKNPTQMNPTQMNPTQMNPTQMNPTMSARLIPALLTVLAGHLVLSGQNCGSDDDPPEGSVFIVYDVLEYDYSMDLTSRDAVPLLTLHALSTGNCVSLDFFLSSSSTPTLNGFEVEWFYEGDGVLELCGQEIAAGEDFTIGTTTTIPIHTYDDTDVGYSVLEDAEGGDLHYLLSWVEGCSYFGPCYNNTDDFAHYVFNITHPPGYQLLCPGTLTSTTTYSTCEFIMDGGPTYTGFGFAASPDWNVVHLSQIDLLSIDVYDMPSLNTVANMDVSSFEDFLFWIQTAVGDYPFGDSLRFFMGPFTWWGFEHPGNIALSQDLLTATNTYTDPLLHVMMHEVTHQWAGNQTTLAGTYDFVWKEAMAEYLTFVFEDEHLPAEYADSTLEIWTSNSVGVRYYPVPEEEPALADYYGDVYGPGPMVLFRQLETLFDRESVLEALSFVLGEPRFLSVEDLQIALEGTLDVELDEYFDEWVYGRGAPLWPILSISITDSDGDGTYSITITQVQNNEVVYGFRSRIRLNGLTSNQVFDVPFSFGINGRDSTVALSATPGFTAFSYELDPEDEALVSLENAPLTTRSMTFRPF